MSWRIADEEEPSCHHSHSHCYRNNDADNVDSHFYGRDPRALRATTAMMMMMPTRAYLGQLPSYHHDQPSNYYCPQTAGYPYYYYHQTQEPPPPPSRFVRTDYRRTTAAAAPPFRTSTWRRAQPPRSPSSQYHYQQQQQLHHQQQQQRHQQINRVPTMRMTRAYPAAAGDGAAAAGASRPSSRPSRVVICAALYESADDPI